MATVDEVVKLAAERARAGAELISGAYSQLDRIEPLEIEGCEALGFNKGLLASAATLAERAVQNMEVPA